MNQLFLKPIVVREIHPKLSIYSCMDLVQHCIHNDLHNSVIYNNTFTIYCYINNTYPLVSDPNVV